MAKLGKYWEATLVATGMVALLGVLDGATGYLLGFFVFYYIPVAFTAWTAGRLHAYIIAFLSAAAWNLAGHWVNDPYSLGYYGGWNTLIRLISFILIGYFVGRVRSLLRHEQELTRELRQALSEVKTLGKLLPICAQCKKIRNDQGYWLQIEEYLHTHAAATFTHGLCKECAEAALRDAGVHPARRGAEKSQP